MCVGRHKLWAILSIKDKRMHVPFQLVNTPAWVWAVAETVVLIFWAPLGKFALQELIEGAVITFPKSCLCPESSKKEAKLLISSWQGPGKVFLSINSAVYYTPNVYSLLSISILTFLNDLEWNQRGFVHWLSMARCISLLAAPIAGSQRNHWEG